MLDGNEALNCREQARSLLRYHRDVNGKLPETWLAGDTESSVSFPEFLAERINIKEICRNGRESR